MAEIEYTTREITIRHPWHESLGLIYPEDDPSDVRGVKAGHVVSINYDYMAKVTRVTPDRIYVGSYSTICAHRDPVPEHAKASDLDIKSTQCAVIRRLSDDEYAMYRAEEIIRMDLDRVALMDEFPEEKPTVHCGFSHGNLRVWMSNGFIEATSLRMLTSHTNESTLKGCIAALGKTYRDVEQAVAAEYAQRRNEAYQAFWETKSWAPLRTSIEEAVGTDIPF